METGNYPFETTQNILQIRGCKNACRRYPLSYKGRLLEEVEPAFSRVDMAEVFFEGKVWAPVTVSKTFVAKRGSETFVTGI